MQAVMRGLDDGVESGIVRRVRSLREAGGRGRLGRGRMMGHVKLVEGLEADVGVGRVWLRTRVS